MAKARTKKRTHVRAQNATAAAAKGGAASMSKTPKSMVIRVGASEVGSSVSQLVKDVRTMMEPDTAVRLKERKSNRLRDYTTMTGPLGVTHLMLFSKSASGNTNMRLALTPRGPTLHFQVENYSLCRDVEKALKRPRGGGQDHKTPPLLVMNNFNSPNATEDSKVPKRLESLSTTIFQSLFPPINPQATPLSSIRRVMLLNRELAPEGEEEEHYVLNLRHYAITTKKTGVSKRIRRLDPKEIRNREKKGAAVPNLGKLEDAADYLLDPSAAGYTSASETEMDTDAEVEVAESTTKKVLSKRELQRMKAGEKEKAQKKLSNAPGVEKRAVKLVELGPRMKLRLLKVEEGLCEGRVMWHDFIKKSEEEVTKLDKNWDQKKKEKEQRKKEQKANIEKKKQAKAQAKAEGKEVEDDDEDDVDMDEDDEWLSDDFEDDNAEEQENDDEDEDESMEE
ncbi:Brix domain-containing protein [Aspergillus vadensis CBS 113365]|uniref:Ribosome biogenesis protein Ssf2 n=2 Tax=Aspergillus subgen. Circumdati TaxID=2720871 RepID=A0A319BKI8_ASPVC|nr:ribosome biogenesis protein Ssf2 [Aspergillus neoniger CBS 115656]XP_025565294.1 ribosome biogenesis protein Ssf2 [Aspergillus vadensis CBS 113365]PYH28896.1 ribosome biogenesis protein Ssf2 [Aspergillus neoniger CBS 115656]PYH71500.1 ribosome biogenesis protein Ssf2 [Aspergillus vadensis CBS 113365]